MLFIFLGVWTTNHVSRLKSHSFKWLLNRPAPPRWMFHMPFTSKHNELLRSFLIDSGNSNSLNQKIKLASIPDSIHTAKIGNKVGWLSILVWVMLIHRRDYNDTSSENREKNHKIQLCTTLHLTFPALWMELLYRFELFVHYLFVSYSIWSPLFIVFLCNTTRVVQFSRGILMAPTVELPKSYPNWHQHNKKIAQ